jgi:hypothetical protein
MAATREAIATIDANLLIIDPRRHNAFELRRLVQEISRKS